MASNSTGSKASQDHSSPAREHAHTLLSLWRHRRASRDEIRRFQERKLRFLIDHAYRNVPFYRRRFDLAGVRPEDIRRPEDLARLPVTRKDDLRAEPVEATIADGQREEALVRRYSSGSTGVSMWIYRTEREDHLLNQFRLRARRMLGHRIGDRCAAVVGLSAASDRTPFSLRALAARFGLERKIIVNCQRPAEQVAREIADHRPDVLTGYPGALAEVAPLWPGLAGGEGFPRLILSGGELLTPSHRRTLQEAFGAPVYDIYGAHEANLISWECDETGAAHVCDDNVIVEILEDGQPVAPGQQGEVVITALHSYASPYIRYSLDDIASLGAETCECGLPFSTIGSLRGRAMDACLRPDGSRLHPWELIPMCFWEMRWHRRHQLLQKSPTHVVLLVIACSEPPDDDLRRLRREALEKLGPGARFEIELVDDLAFAESGKHQVCRSEIGA